MTNRDRLNEMFKGLRRKDLVARQRFLCCGGCASCEIGELAEKRGKRGGVYYHQQDAEWLDKGADHVYLGYGALGESDARGIGIDVVIAAGEAGLAVEWNGTPEQRIKVLLPGGLAS